MKTIRIGTRGSQLALAQTQLVEDLLRASHPALALHRVVIHSRADREQNTPLTRFQARGVFVKELEKALLEREIDLAVHSLKDMPSLLPEGLTLTVTPERADPSDSLISDGKTLQELQPGAVVGTSSPRRKAFLRFVRPDLVPTDIRGSVDTRLRKMVKGGYHALILASAGLHRLGWGARITQRLPPESFIPAPGQGALALEVRADDTELMDMLQPLNHPDSALAVEAERAFQAELKAGCSAAVGAYAYLQGEELILHAAMASLTENALYRTTERGSSGDARQIGIRAARTLKEIGAAILRSSS
jgi:hydroxymethylbilane synthase